MLYTRSVKSSVLEDSRLWGQSLAIYNALTTTSNIPTGARSYVAVTALHQLAKHKSPGVHNLALLASEIAHSAHII